jgi:predicted nucleic acid-binding Zn ribbon protein
MSGGTADPPNDEVGAAVVRAALGRARARSAAAGLRPGQSGTVAGRRRRTSEASLSGAHPDARDPQPFGSAVDRLVAELGWQTPVAVGGVLGRWDDIVGEQIAEHCQPETFAEGVLTLRTTSTAWASQLRLLSTQLRRRLAQELGDGVVTRIVVRGPTAPSWKRGRYSVAGRGPRDTYG